MRLFFLTFILVYGAAHAYFFWRFVCAIPLFLPARLFLVHWLCLMVAAPFAVRILERDGYEQAARLAAYTGYSWMGFLFLFISLSLVLELARVSWWLGSYFVRLPRPALLEPFPFLLLCLIPAAVICCYGWFEASNLRAEHVVVTTDKLGSRDDRVRIAQISDLHIGLIVQEQQVQRVVELIEQYRVDLVVATGDLVDGHVSHFDGISERLRKLQPRLGKYAVFGNHEYYAGLGQSRRFLEQSGFRIVRGEGLAVGNRLWLVGVDDPVAGRSGDYRADDEQRLLEAVPQDRFRLLLKHRPVATQTAADRPGLQLSGHVHKGQIFPFNLLTWLNFPVRSGLNRLSPESWLYVNRGTGTWGPPIRFLAPPEVTIIDIVPVGR